MTVVSAEPKDEYQLESQDDVLLLKLRYSGFLHDDDRVVIQELCARRRLFKARDDIVREGDPVGSLYIVLEWFAMRYKTLRNGERQIVALLLPGDLCTLQSITLGRNDHSIAACTDCSIAELSPRTVDDLTLTPSRIARALWWATLVEESILRQWLINNGRRQGIGRLAHLLCEVLTRLWSVGYATTRSSCEFPFTLDQIADMLGLTPVHVSRVMRELRDCELITLTNNQLMVPNVDRLEAFCEYDPIYLYLYA